MAVPDPTPLLRLIHVENLHIYLQRGAIHAPKSTPADGLVYRTIHNADIQAKRHALPVPCGPGGVLHDYASFYFGYHSPMMLQLKTGRVEGYTDGQDPLIYLVSTAQALRDSGASFVFSDGHGIAAFTKWFDDLTDLDQIDWDVVSRQYWADTTNDMDRQRRKQAEFLVHQSCDWSLIREIAVVDDDMKDRVEDILSGFGGSHRPLVNVRRNWYYP